MDKVCAEQSRCNEVAPATADTCTSTQEHSASASFFRNYYGPLLLHPVTKALALLLLLLYLAISIWGCTQVVQGLKYTALVRSDHYFLEYFKVEKEYMKSPGFQAEIVFSHPPNMTIVENRAKVSKIVEEFENSSFTSGEEGTQFWLRAYKNFLTQTDSINVPDARHIWENGVWAFCQSNAFYQTWSQDVAWNYANDSDRRSIKAFRFRVELPRFFDPEMQRATVHELRTIAAKYPEYDLTTFGYLWDFVDQYNEVLPNTLQNVGIALGCMMVVSLLLIPSPLCTVWITLAIVSIDLGVVGFMTWWHLNLDAISMITIIMSIGFSVDFTAHITYGYVSSKGSADERTVNAMEKLGWPLFQGALSTVIGVMVLGLVDSYLVVVFFRAVCLIIVFGVLHALVFLPVVLSLAMPVMELVCRKPLMSS